VQNQHNNHLYRPCIPSNSEANHSGRHSDNVLTRLTFSQRMRRGDADQPFDASNTSEYCHTLEHHDHVLFYVVISSLFFAML